MIEILPIQTGSDGNAIFISDGSTNILLDCGVNFKKIQKTIGYRTIDACLVTHEHQDHCKAIKDLVKMGIDICMSNGTKTALNLSDSDVLTVQPLKDYVIGTWTITPVDIEHDAAEPLGFLLKTATTNETVVYLTDLLYCKYLFPGVTYWIIECNHITEILNGNLINGNIGSQLHNRIRNNHMNLDTLKHIFMFNDIVETREIYLTHLSDRNANAERMKREIQILTGKVVHVI
jgi:phosphoribosyl 1,2-cyclic phosphodiesterase